MPVDQTRKQLQQQRRSLRSLLQANPALLLSALYLLLTLAGLLYSVLLFRVFDLRYVDFAQPSDFLMASAKEPALVLMLLASLLTFRIMLALDMWSRKHFSWYEAIYRLPGVEQISYRPWFLGGVVLVYALLFTSMYAGWVADSIRAGDKAQVLIELNEEAGGDRLLRVVLGTTSAFMLVYEPDSREVRAIPFGSLRSVVVNGAGAAGSAPASAPLSAPSSTPVSPEGDLTGQSADRPVEAIDEGGDRPSQSGS